MKLDTFIILECILTSIIISSSLPCLYNINLEEKYKSHFCFEFFQLIFPLLGSIVALNISSSIRLYFLCRLIFSIPILLITLLKVRPLSHLKYAVENSNKYPKLKTFYLRAIEIGLYEQGLDFFIKFYINVGISKYMLGTYSLASSIARFGNTINISAARRFRAKIHDYLFDKKWGEFNKLLIKSNYISITGCSLILFLTLIYLRINTVQFLGIFYTIIILLLLVSYQKTFLFIITEAFNKSSKNTNCSYK